MKARLLVLSLMTVGLVGCQTINAPNSNAGSSQTVAVQKEVWVDLTPYPKANTQEQREQDLSEPESLREVGTWAVTYSDGTIRQALTRWADTAGWSFNNTHYELSVDIPITAEATLIQRGSFKQGVQALVEAVALSGHPVRACFYQNKVLRIVGYNTSCNARVN